MIVTIQFILSSVPWRRALLLKCSHERSMRCFRAARALPWNQLRRVEWLRM